MSFGDNPSFHDKIEFNLVPTCYALDFVDWEKLYSEHFSVNEIKTLKTELKQITNNAITNILANQFELDADIH